MQNVFTKEAGMTNYQIKDLKYHDNNPQRQWYTYM